jgi:hypothetical protein
VGSWGGGSRSRIARKYIRDRLGAGGGECWGVGFAHITTSAAKESERAVHWRRRANVESTTTRTPPADRAKERDRVGESVGMGCAYMTTSAPHASGR